MLDIYNVSLVDLLPDSLKDDDLKDIAEVLSFELQEITWRIKKVLLLKNIDDLSDDIIFHLLYQYHMTENEVLLETNIGEKRNLIKNAIKIHRTKGTKASLMLVLESLNMRGIIKEWFEYGGQPFHFKIEMDKEFENESDIPVLLRLLYANGRKSARLDAIWFSKGDGVYFKVVHTDRIRIKPVISLRTGIVMPGESSQARVMVMSVSANGVATPYFAGEIYPGQKNISPRVGTKTASFLLMSRKYVSGYSAYQYTRIPLGNARAENILGASIISPHTKSGAANVTFCGKTYAGERW